MVPTAGKHIFPEPAGILVLLKPPGLTSQEAVTLVKKAVGAQRAGHTGTLDPGVAGVLPIAVGRATRLIAYLPEGPKAYRAELTLGISTDTQDSSGRAEGVTQDFRIPASEVLEALASFVGPGWQVPPMVSAVHFGGRRLYELAREGKVVDRPPRPVEVYELHVLPGHQAELGFGSRVLFDIKVSRGFYVRTLCHDLGVKLGVGAHLSFLVRTESFPFSLAQGLTVEEIQSMGQKTPLISPGEALAHYPAVTLTYEEERRVRHGNAVVRPLGERPALGAARRVRLASPEGRLIAVARPATGPAGSLLLQPERVLEETD